MYALITEDKDWRTQRARVTLEQAVTWLEANELDPNPVDFVLATVTVADGGKS